MKIHRIEQMSDEWFELRRGRMTGSHGQEIANNGKGLDTYLHTLMAGYFATTQEERYTNADLERGIALEETAIAMYSAETGYEIDQVGFVEIDEYIGCSPDGMVKEHKGLIEVKCKNNTNHFKNFLYGEKKIESKYIWQMQMNMLLTKSDWCDYIAYNPNFEKDLIIIRIKANEEKFDKLKIGIEAGKRKIDEIKEKYLKLKK